MFYILKYTTFLIVKSTRDCKNLLNRYRGNFVCKCGNRESIKQTSLVEVCSKCKLKYSVTNGTIFHNVRFGLLKAFRIVIEEYKNSFTSSSTQVAKKYKITQKTAWLFLDKIRKNKDGVIDFVEFINNPKKKRIKSKSKPPKPKQDNKDKLKVYLKKTNLKNGFIWPFERF